MNDSSLKPSSLLGRIWRFARWPLGVLAVLYVGLLVYRFPIVIEKKKTEEQVAKIHATKLTMNDVMGVNLPPAPDPLVKDATVAGVDANSNGIRDDVELAIFAEYPNSAKIRAALLQYALALQMYLVAVLNSDTLIAVAQEDERASSCLADQLSRNNIQTYYRDLQEKKNEIKGMILNTEERQTRANQNTWLVRSFGSLNEPSCDVDPKSLPN